MPGDDATLLSYSYLCDNLQYPHTDIYFEKCQEQDKGNEWEMKDGRGK